MFIDFFLLDKDCILVGTENIYRLNQSLFP